jgi:hypothetical protein
MRWTQRIRIKFPIPEIPEDACERESALKQSTAELGVIQQRQPKIDQIHREAVQNLRDNHFVQRLEIAYNMRGTL